MRFLIKIDAEWSAVDIDALRDCECGGEAALHFNDYRRVFEVRCSRCPAFVWDERPEKAGEIWNRAPEARAKSIA